ncbi:hypothetical protein LAV79_00290 [Peribacillus butanolivorans]|uniref:hypothetical protein n=1 Tax=Peribacillus butanolivorans TaxID=421767 RepID=UPI0030C96C6E
MGENKKQFLGLVCFLTFLMIMCMLFINSYYSHRGIMDASNKCFDHNGMPMVEKSENAFSISWSVVCEP